MTTLYILRYLAYKSRNSHFHGIFTSKEAAVDAAYNYDQDSELKLMLNKENKFYDGNGSYVINEIKTNTFYKNLNDFL